MKQQNDVTENWFQKAVDILHERGDRFYELRYFKTIDSTNEAVKRAAAEGAAEGLVIVGEEQTAGKGRRGRNWKSPAGESVYMSVLLKPVLPVEALSELTLVMGLSVAQAVSGLYGLDAAIKWPNDIVIRGKKICGILTELIPERTHRGTGSAPDAAPDTTGSNPGTPAPCSIVIGTGINVNNTAFPAELADKAVSLRMIRGEKTSRGRVLAETLLCFRDNYRICLRTGDLSGIQEAYNSRLISRGRPVRIEDPRGPYTGISRGIDTSGRLIVERSDGKVEAISSGEVSVRGLYGYV
jgi:BirA family biotin operon repressor/biotin-[acetyl-CoA-carboxylase] ligase